MSSIQTIVFFFIQLLHRRRVTHISLTHFDRIVAATTVGIETASHVSEHRIASKSSDSRQHKSHVKSSELMFES